MATEEDDGGARVIEAFPTGLVVSKHFREASTGREILMLEVEKARTIGRVVEVIFFIPKAQNSVRISWPVVYVH